MTDRLEAGVFQGANSGEGVASASPRLGSMGIAPLPFIGLAAALVYLLILPHSALATVLVLLGTILVCAGANKETLGVACLVVAPTLVGALLRVFDIPYVGAMSSVALGLFLLYGLRFRRGTSVGRWGQPITWLLVTVAVLLLSYTYGPQTEYSQDKLVRFLAGIVVAIIAFSFVVSEPAVDLWRLGIIGVASSVGCYWALTLQNPELLPSSIWTPCGLKIASDEMEVTLATNTIAAMACLGLVCMVGASLDRRLTKGRMLEGVLALAVALLVINSAGQRLFMLIPPVAAAAVFLCRPKEKRLPAAVLIIALLTVVGVSLVGLAREDPRFLQTFDTEAALGDRLNRSTNWDAALVRIEEQPLWGHGLGGYYIDGYSRPGEGTYAHNVVLELASETGLVGVVIVLAPAVFFLIYRRRRVLTFRTAGGGSLVPLLVMAVLHAMISHDLRNTFQMFALVAVLWAYVSPAPSPITLAAVRPQALGAA